MNIFYVLQGGTMSGVIINELTVKIRSLNHTNAINLGNWLANCPLAKKYIIDFSEMVSVYPFGMITTILTINHFTSTVRAELSKNDVEPIFESHGIDLFHSQAHGYAEYVGFFKEIEFIVDPLSGNASGGSTYFPITKLSISRIHEIAEERCMDYNTVIEGYAGQLAAVIAKDELIEMYGITSYCIRELIRNAVEHSKGRDIYICGQYFPGNNSVEVAIADHGVGIYKSLKENINLNIDSTEAALKCAIQPGISGKFFLEQIDNEENVNSGFGLYVTSQLCNKYGQFFITSHDKSLLLMNNNKSWYDSRFFGTSVSLNFSTNIKLQYKEILDNIIANGERLVKMKTKNLSFAASRLSRKY